MNSRIYQYVIELFSRASWNNSVSVNKIIAKKKKARDLNILGAKYDVGRIQPVDMFPHTHHIENIVQLKLKK